MRCPYCRGNFELQGPFCPLCGRRIIGSSRQDAEEQQESAPAAAQAPPSGRPGPAAPPAPPSFSGAPGSDDVLVVDLGPEPSGPTPRPRPGPPLPFSTAAAQQAAQSQAAGAPRSEPAREPFIGRTCPYCRFPLKQKEEMTVCPACAVAHHSDCWHENGGCTTYACRYSPESHPPEAMPVVGTMPRGTTPYQPMAVPGAFGGPMPPGHATLAARFEAKATNALVLSLMGLFCFGILSLAGLLLGLTVLVQMKTAGVQAPVARSRAALAVVFGIAVPAILLLLYAALAHTPSVPGPRGF